MEKTLKKWIRPYAEGYCLFTRDDAATNVFVILKGTIQLYKRGENAEQLVGTLGAGDILGEKLLVEDTPYQHSFTARVRSACEVIQFDPKDLPQIEKQIPHFKLRLLAAVTGRLNKANEFIQILQTTDILERVLRYLLYFAAHHGPILGEQSPLKSFDIAKILQLEPSVVEESMKSLAGNRALSGGPDEYSIAKLDVLKHQLTSRGK